LACLCQISGDEIALRIYIRVNSVKELKLMLHKFNGNVVRCRTNPQWDASYHTICFPDSQVMSPRYD
jgi:hypothetical protein